MFGLSFWEIAIILGVALIVLGPSKLPELARSLGKGLREFRRATDDFKSTIDEELHKPDPQKSPKRIEAPLEEAEVVPPVAAKEEPVEATEKKEALSTES